jgi:transcriptional regulator of aromatic amino acid metabolism
MSKKVELIIEIDKNGKILVTPKNTVGKECMELMAFLDKIDGITVIETIPLTNSNKECKDHIVEKIIEK